MPRETKITSKLSANIARLSIPSNPIVGVVLILSVADRKQFQTQAEKQIRRQSYPVAKIRACVSGEEKAVADTVERARASGCDKVFVMDGTGYYSPDYIEACLRFPKGDIPFPVSWTRTDKKRPPEKLKEILRLDYDFFARVYGF